MRLLAILALVCTLGCSKQEDLRPFVAVAGAYGIMQSEPTPAPSPDVCENCGGRGVVGDGVIEIPCPACRKGELFEVIVETPPAVVTPPASPHCKDGKCPPSRTTRR